MACGIEGMDGHDSRRLQVQVQVRSWVEGRGRDERTPLLSLHRCSPKQTPSRHGMVCDGCQQFDGLPCFEMVRDRPLQLALQLALPPAAVVCRPCLACCSHRSSCRERASTAAWCCLGCSPHDAILCCFVVPVVSLAAIRGLDRYGDRCKWNTKNAGADSQKRHKPRQGPT
jgi:hypothetical protein